MATHQDFDQWHADGMGPALLKIHGSLAPDQVTLRDPVVVDVVELGQLSASRLTAVHLLGTVDHLLVTGYAGEDIDVYRPLLAAIARTRTVWRQYTVDETSSIDTDLRQAGATLYKGAPDGLATTGLAEVLGLDALPPWPHTRLPGEPYEVMFAHWADRLCARHPAEELASAYAWLLADLGEYDRAELILRHVVRRRPSASMRFRHADVLYHRFHEGDRASAAWQFFRVAITVRIGHTTRLHALLRLGDCARTLMRHAPYTLPFAVLPALAVLILTRAGRSQREFAADAYRSLQQLSLRVFERLAARIPRYGRRGLAAACNTAARWGAAGLRLASNGNRRALLTQQRLTLLVIADLLTGRSPAPEIPTTLASLRDSYRNGDDLAGAGNCGVSLALCMAALGDAAAAQEALAEARHLYALSRPDGPPNPTGIAFADAASRLMATLTAAPQWL